MCCNNSCYLYMFSIVLVNLQLPDFRSEFDENMPQTCLSIKPNHQVVTLNLFLVQAAHESTQSPRVARWICLNFSSPSHFMPIFYGQIRLNKQRDALQVCLPSHRITWKVQKTKHKFPSLFFSYLFYGRDATIFLCNSTWNVKWPWKCIATGCKPRWIQNIPMELFKIKDRSWETLHHTLTL